MIISIPLILVAYTHLWNVTGFPLFHTDEGHYMRRILGVLYGIGIQEQSGFYADRYDHPFFGQILIGTLLKLIGYPNYLMSQTQSSIELAIAFPRIIMGLFAVIDTFLIFKISQRLSNTAVALFASVLFAVSPMSWQFRLITLDNIAMPFLLASILFSISMLKWNRKLTAHKGIFLVLLSGTFLGISMLTKVPFFIMIPLVGYLIYKNSNHVKSLSPLKTMVIWLIPIIIIPSIWPLYAFSIGEFDLWQDGIMGQIDRRDRRIEIMESFFSVDSILFFLGFAGLMYSFVRKNWTIILWVMPFIIFVYIHGWFNPFHWVIVLPAFCIGGAILVMELIKMIQLNTVKKSLAMVTVCTVIAGIGLFNTFMIINLNLEKDAVEGIVESLDYMDRADGVDDNKINEKITVIADTPYSWIYKYVYNLNQTPDTTEDIGKQEISTNKTIIFQDGRISDVFYQLEKKFSSLVLDIGRVKKICNLDIKWYKTDAHTQSHVTIMLFVDYELSNGIMFEADSTIGKKNAYKVDMKNTSARYINITGLQIDNKDNIITDIRINGKNENSEDCKRIPIRKIIFADNSLRFRSLDDYNVIVSYQKLINEIDKISKYRTQTADLTYTTQIFSPLKYHSRSFELLANY